MPFTAKDAKLADLGWTSRNKMNFYTSARNNPTDQIFVFFSEEKSVGVKTMRKSVFIATHGYVTLCLCPHF